MDKCKKENYSKIKEVDVIMLLKENVPLSKYTTFRMGGIAKKMYFPESVEELVRLGVERKDIFHYIIGGGSNLLINDKKCFDVVLCLRNFNTKITR